MPSDQPKKRFALEGFDNTHYRRTQRYVNIVTRLYDEAVADIANIAVKEKVDPDKPFSFKDYPRAMKLVNEEITSLTRNITAVVQKGTREEWLYACQKNDEFLKSILDTSKLEKKTLESMQDRNLDALKTFQERKINGMNLSERVWKYNDQFKDQIEQGIDVGLGEGTSAAQLSRDLRQNLNDPDRLFRRVRDKRGNLHLSKNAKAFNPGQGVYRSSTKNAMRLTRTEINMAYRESDHLRWQQLAFVIGFEIKVSDMHQRWLDEYWNKHNPGKIEICDVLTGKYPKWFKFTGWHPQCMCYATPILMNDEEFRDRRVSRFRDALKGDEFKKYQSKDEIKDAPDAFKEWIDDNAEKQRGWKSTPYFIRDNFKGGKIDGGLKYVPEKKATPAIKPKVETTIYSENMPEAFKRKSKYLRGEDYTFAKEFFDLLDKDNPITLKITRGKSSFYSRSEKQVTIANTERNERSAWKRKAVVYHEYGHAIDDQKNLKGSKNLSDLRKVQIERLSEKSFYSIWKKKYNHDERKYEDVKVKVNASSVAYIDHKLDQIDKKLWRMSDSTFTRRGITKSDAREQIGATRDTIKSLFVKLGHGHSVSYYNRKGNQEAEYLAHAFENAYAGNVVFKKYLPDIYEEMIDYIRGLK